MEQWRTTSLLYKNYIKGEVCCARMPKLRSLWQQRKQWQLKHDGGKQSVYYNFYWILKIFYIFFNNVWIVSRKVHDPQRPHLDKGYTVEDYKKLTLDMMAKVKDLKTVMGSPSIKNITTQLLFRYCMTLWQTFQCSFIMYLIHNPNGCLGLLTSLYHVYVLHWSRHGDIWTYFFNGQFLSYI